MKTAAIRLFDQSRYIKMTDEEFKTIYGPQEITLEVLEDIKTMTGAGRNDNLHGDEDFLETDYDLDDEDEELEALADEWEKIINKGK